MVTCKACGRSVRATFRACVLGEKGAQRSRVCRRCRSGGLVVVSAVAKEPELPRVVHATDPLSTVLLHVVGMALRQVETWAKAADAMAEGQKGMLAPGKLIPQGSPDFYVGRSEGLRSAAEAVRAEVARARA